MTSLLERLDQIVESARFEYGCRWSVHVSTGRLVTQAGDGIGKTP